MAGLAAELCSVNPVLADAKKKQKEEATATRRCYSDDLVGQVRVFKREDPLLASG